MAAMGVDEPGSIKHKAWRNGVARVRHPRSTLRQKVAGGTPADAATFINLEVEKWESVIKAANISLN